MSESIYAPKLNYETGIIQEDKTTYLKRVHVLLPNFPDEVVLQWFYDHPHQVHDHEWLLYRSLKFDLCSWEIDKVPVRGFGNDAAVETYIYNYFVKGCMSSRRERIESYFQKHGSWPVPPIFLSNPKGVMKYPHGFPCGTPYHLLEGHNRMAFFIEYKKREKLSECHLVYVAKKT